MHKNLRILTLVVLACTSMASTLAGQSLSLEPFQDDLYAVNEQDAQVNDWTMARGSAAKPLEVSWKLLMDIDYKLKYYKEIEMEMYAPIFTKAVKALDGKEISIKGFVIPIDEQDGFFALSANPYASCFFCGKASPASIISIHLKDKNKRYKLDEIKTFSGVMTLNYDNPNEFYYILNNAR
ncbi:MAG: DUF3299 domain-containing protein [Bacteroidota bacterium]